MASPLYLRSTDGSDADNGTTWPLAKATIVGIGAIDDANNGITYVSDNHSETTAGAVNPALGGTSALPYKVLCVDDTGDPSPPTALSTGAVIASTGGNNLTIGGTGVWHGITFQCGSGTGTTRTLSIGASFGWQHHTSCNFQMLGTGASSRISPQAGELLLENCTFKFSATAQGLGSFSGFHWNGGSIDGAGSAITTLFLGANSGVAILENLDLSAGASAMNIFDNGLTCLSALLRNCKMPASWSGALVASGATINGWTVDMVNCDSGDTNYRNIRQQFAGIASIETTIVRTGGASDGTVPTSWKMVTNANAHFHARLVSRPHYMWNDSVSSITVTVEVVTDGVTLTDKEAWIEVTHPDDVNFPLGKTVTDGVDFMTGATNQASSSVAWTTTGLTTPVKHKLSVTFTPDEKGPLSVVVVLAKASTTMYADIDKPVIT